MHTHSHTPSDLPSDYIDYIDYCISTISYAYSAWDDGTNTTNAGRGTVSRGACDVAAEPPREISRNPCPPCQWSLPRASVGRGRGLPTRRRRSKSESGRWSCFREPGQKATRRQQQQRRRYRPWKACVQEKKAQVLSLIVQNMLSSSVGCEYTAALQLVRACHPGFRCSAIYGAPLNECYRADDGGGKALSRAGIVFWISHKLNDYPQRVARSCFIYLLETCRFRTPAGATGIRPGLATNLASWTASSISS